MASLSRVVPPRPARQWRAFIATLVFFSFFAQSYLAQTHIHPLADSGQAGWSASGNKSASVTAAQLRNGRHQVPNDSSDCPLCQAAVHATGVFTDLSYAIASPLVYLQFSLPLLAALLHSLYQGHDKQQRGPPAA